MSFPGNEYTPVEYDNPLNQGQDPDTFYGNLIDSQTGLPSQIFCRMSDSLFFYLNMNCPVNQASGVLEPEKIAWREIAVGEKQEILKFTPIFDFGSIYLKASIPHSFNSNREPVLDRRGFLHLLVFEVRADPVAAYKDWSCLLNVLKLVDPLTRLYFPTPVPRSALPAEKDAQSNAIFEGWKRAFMAKLRGPGTSTQSRSQAVQQQPATVSAPISNEEKRFAEYQQALRQQESLVMRSQLNAAAHRTRMNIINSIGGFRDRNRY